MYARILIAITASAAGFATAHAQSDGGSFSGSIGSGTSGGSLGTGTPPAPTRTIDPGSAGTGSSGMTPGSMGSQSAPNQAQSRPFSASHYTTMPECVSAAQAAGLTRDACNAVK